MKLKSKNSLMRLLLFIIIATVLSGQNLLALDVDDTANADLYVKGTVSGSYADTQVSDNGYESITERESGGKPSRRHSYLEHKWTVNVTGGDAVTFYVEAHQSASSDGDNFVFAYSTNDSTYTDMVTVTKTADDDAYQSYAMPASLSGTVYIRVMDTDQTQGNRGLDTISIDDLFIRSAVTDPSPGTYTYVMDTRIGSGDGIPITGDSAWTGDDITNWLKKVVGCDYFRNNNDGSDCIGRINDGNWSFSIPANAIQITMETTGRFCDGYVVEIGLGSALDSGTSMDNGLFRFGIYSPDDYQIRHWNGSGSTTRTVAGDPPNDDTQTLRLEVDLTANGGDGSAELFVDDVSTVTAGNLYLKDSSAPALTDLDTIQIFSNSRYTGPGDFTITVTEGAPDTDPPTPDPMTFAVAPAATGPTSIQMTATTASDPSGVEYYFTCTAGGGNDSGWQDSTYYEDTGLSPDTQYTYTVTASDKSAAQNTTAPSSGASATTDPPLGPIETVEAALGNGTGTYLEIKADGGSDTRNGITADPPGSYGWGFPDTSDSGLTINGNCNDDKENPNSEIQVDISGLSGSTTYDWYVVALGATWDYDLEYGTQSGNLTRIIDVYTHPDTTVITGSDPYLCGVYAGKVTSDGSGNLTLYFGAGEDFDLVDGWRTQLDGFLLEESPDPDPPTPDPMTWSSSPTTTGPTSIKMTATTASDLSGVEYYFTCTAGGGNDSGWQDSTYYEDTGLIVDTQYTYTVTARDKSAAQNTTAPSSEASATTAVLSPIEIVEVALGNGTGTYLEIKANGDSDTRNGITADPPGSYGWNFPDSSNSDLTINANCNDDKDTANSEIQVDVSGLANNTTYDWYVVALGTVRYDLEYGTQSGSLTRIADVHTNPNTTVIASDSGLNLCGVYAGKVTSDGSGNLTLYFGAGEDFDLVDGWRTQLDGFVLEQEDPGKYIKQYGDPGWVYDPSRYDSSFPAMPQWATAGVQGGIPYRWSTPVEATLSAVGGDNSDEIQAAIDSVYASGGGVVLLNNGTYRIDNQIQMKSNVILRGQSKSGVLLEVFMTYEETTEGDRKETISFADVQYAGLEDLSMIYNADYSGQQMYPLDHDWDFHDWFVWELRSQNYTNSRVYHDRPNFDYHTRYDMDVTFVKFVSNVENCWLDNCDFRDCASEVIFINDGWHVTIRNCLVQGAFQKGDWGAGYGINCYGQYVLMVNNTVKNVRHWAIQHGAQYCVIYKCHSWTDMNFHQGDGGTNLIEKCDIHLPAFHLWNVFQTGADYHGDPGAENAFFDNWCIETDGDWVYDDQQVYTFDVRDIVVLSPSPPSGGTLYSVEQE